MFMMPPEHTHPKNRMKKKKENKNCPLRVISQVDEIFKNKKKNS